MTIAERELQIQKTLKQIEVAGASRASLQQQITQLRLKQRQHLIAARVEGDAKAQKEVENLSQELMGLEEENRLACETLALLSERLGSEKDQLRRDSWRLRCLAVVERIQQAIDVGTERRLIEVARELKKLVAQEESTNSAIQSALYGLDRAFYDDAREFIFRQGGVRNELCLMLQDELHIPGHYIGGGLERMTEWRARFLQRLKDAADNPPLEQPSGETTTAQILTADTSKPSKHFATKKLQPVVGLNPVSAR